jgi:hypothetical protein
MFIDNSRLGGWDHPAGMALGHTFTGNSGDQGYWPSNATGSPATWGNTAFGDLAQTINFAPLPDRELGEPGFLVTPAASSGLEVSVSSLTPDVCEDSMRIVTLVGGGTCTLRASQPGGDGYLAAPNVTRSFEVNTDITYISLPVVQK